MSEEKLQKFPFRSLGFRLRTFRENNNRSIEDVSGAVEIDPQSLKNIEDGLKLPEEDILLLLISYFNLKPNEAKKMWELAGYDNLTNNAESETTDTNIQVPTILLVPFDNKVIYSDLLQVASNNYGLTLNFMQTNGLKNNTPHFVSRVGVSREHARDIIKMLKQALEETAKKPGSQTDINQSRDNKMPKSN
ncbi:MAG TPA: helix-turn-helix transcriptional regulator [Candidatus Saccharimonadia bacterium]|nr:helix-turn-helix transcriptional regulator [Candidatus Saccharimonadia bacterium]